MAIQLHEKYRKALVDRYAHKSYVKGRTSEEYESNPPILANT